MSFMFLELVRGGIVQRNMVPRIAVAWVKDISMENGY